MIQELRHGVDPLPARWAPRNNDALAAFRHARRILDVVVEGVTVNLGLQCAEKFWLCQ
jgi:hypothetical protein